MGSSYHMTIFVLEAPGETADDVVALIEPAVIAFCGERYVRVEPIEGEEGEDWRGWSYNAVVCDPEAQYVSAMPFMKGADTFGLYFDDRELVFEPCAAPVY